MQFVLINGKNFAKYGRGSSQKADLYLKNVVKNLGRGLGHINEGTGSYPIAMLVPPLGSWLI